MHYTVRAVIGIGPRGLIKAFNHESEEVQETVRYLLVGLARISPGTIPALIEALNEKNDLVRRGASETLGLLAQDGRIDQPIVPTLIGILSRSDGVAREAAIGALRQSGRVAIPPLRKLLQHDDSAIRAAAVKALRLREVPGLQDVTSSVEAVNVLVEQLKEGDSVMRKNAVKALGKIGPAAKEAIPEILQSLRDKDSDLRKAAVEALGKIGSEDGEALVPIVIETFKDKEEEDSVRGYAAEALGTIRPISDDAIQALSQTLEDGNHYMKFAASVGLVRIGKSAVPALILALDSKNRETREIAISALSRMGTPAIPALSQALTHESELLRNNAARVLKLIQDQPSIR